MVLGLIFTFCIDWSSGNTDHNRPSHSYASFSVKTTAFFNIRVNFGIFLERLSSKYTFTIPREFPFSTQSTIFFYNEFHKLMIFVFVSELTS